MDNKVSPQAWRDAFAITASFWGGAAACIGGYIIGYVVVGPLLVRVMGW